LTVVFGAALALVEVAVSADVVLGSVFVSEPQPDSTRASAAVNAAAPEIAVRLMNHLLSE
jgi:hypothetical protein